MWTPATRAEHSRATPRYASDLTDAEWALLEPSLPRPAGRGRRWKWPMREVIDAILYVLRSGCPWRLLPNGFPPYGTVWYWFRRLHQDGTFERLMHRLLRLDRERCGREPSPSAAIMDSQTARTCESGGPRGYDGAKRIVGRKRHALVDTDGRLLVVGISAADLQDRDGAGPLVRASRRRFPFIEHVYVDRGYQGRRVREGSPVPVHIVQPHPGQIGFAVQPRRWVVERTFAWLGRNRRLWKDAEPKVRASETTVASSTAFVHAAAANVLLRRLARA